VDAKFAKIRKRNAGNGEAQELVLAPSVSHVFDLKIKLKQSKRSPKILQNEFLQGTTLVLPKGKKGSHPKVSMELFLSRGLANLFRTSAAFN